MNYHIKAQIRNMIEMTEAFKAACYLAATQDDMTIDKNEEKTLKKINAAADRFIKDLSKIKVDD